MANAIFLAPAGSKVGLTSISQTILRILAGLRIKAGYFKPIEQLYNSKRKLDCSLELIKQTAHLEPQNFITGIKAKQALTQGLEQELLEQVIALYRKAEENCDLIIIEGLYTNKKMPFASRINTEIARAIDAEIVLVTSMFELNNLAELNSLLEINIRTYGGGKHPKIIGSIINHVNVPQKNQNDDNNNPQNQEPPELITKKLLQTKCDVFKNDSFALLGVIPWNANLSAPRTLDVANLLNANYLHQGNIKKRRVLETVIGAATLSNVCTKLKSNTLLLVPGDRENIILGACMAALNGVNIAGILLTDGLLPKAEILQFCKSAMTTGLPILTTEGTLYQTALTLENMSSDIPLDDVERMDATIFYLTDCIETAWLQQRSTSRESSFSPPAFRYALIKAAKEAKKKIVLPEGEEPRIINAAIVCHQKEIAKCILLGNRTKILQQAELNGLVIPADLQILDPEIIRENYVAPLMELRKHKGLTEEMAHQTLEDAIVVGTMMVHLNEVDGLVAGVIHTTANTVRPALRILKTKANINIVSSIFFMCLPDQVVVYGDCAVNPDPTAEELADIAIQSADSAKAFGINPKVAMISYSTGTSGTGGDVDKVTTATKLAQQKRPDLLIDGPLQYDAAAIESVAKSKAPNSKVAGRATVFVFPDLNTGNTTYKAVQRNANVVSIGPMLQGLKKPVNDLSRGALVDDIVYTIALTCIQATQT